MTFKRHRLAQRRKAMGFTQELMAEQLGVERSTVVRWERGETEPQPWQRPHIAQTLQLSMNDLHELLLADGAPIPESEDERLHYVLKHPSSVDLVAVAYLREQVQRLDEQYDRVPSSLLLAEAGQCHGQVAFLRQYALGGRVRRELHAAEAESATLMGQLVWDASQRRNHVASLTYFDQAIAAARQTRDAATEAHAHLRKSYVALYGTHDPRTGLALTQDAVAASNGVSHILAALALLHMAEAYAMMSKAQDCHDALSAADDHFGKVKEDDPAGHLACPTHWGRLAGSCYLFLGEAQQAQTTLEATTLLLQQRKKSTAIVLGNLTLACIRLKKIDEAAAKLQEAIDIVELTRGGGGLNSVAAGRALRPWRHESVVQDVNDRLLALMAS